MTVDRYFQKWVCIKITFNWIQDVRMSFDRDKKEQYCSETFRGRCSIYKLGTWALNGCSKYQYSSVIFLADSLCIDTDAWIRQQMPRPSFVTQKEKFLKKIFKTLNMKSSGAKTAIWNFLSKWAFSQGSVISLLCQWIGSFHCL